jgi:choice-of-anchor B domain-containing protein
MAGLTCARTAYVVLLLSAVAMAPHDGGDGKDFGHSSPSGIGGNGPWASKNIQLLSRLSIPQMGGGSGVLGNDLWGWTDPLTGKEYALVGLSNALAFVDLSNPRDPKYLGKLPTQTGNSVWRGVKVYANHAFVVADNNGAHGMQVFDLTALRTVTPANPQTFSNTALYNGVTRCHNIFINEDTGFAYLVGCNVASGGLHIVNVSNPANPVFVANFASDGYTHDVQTVVYNGPDTQYSGREIAFCSNEDTVTIVDVTDKANLVMISRNTYGQSRYTHQGWLSEDQRYFYMDDELDESNLGTRTRTHVFDFLDLDVPVYRGHFTGPTRAIDHNLYVKGNKVYAGNYTSGLRVMQIGANPWQLGEVGFFDTFNTNTAVTFDGVWTNYPFFDSGIITVNDRQNGLFVLKLSEMEFLFPDGVPAVIRSPGQIEFTVRVQDLFGSHVPGTAVLHVDRGNGFESFPMPVVAPQTLGAQFPATPCGEEVRFYVSAQASDGSIECYPPLAPNDYFNAWSTYDSAVVLNDNFETSTGWSVSGNATQGAWVRGVPLSNPNNGEPSADYDGSGQCFVTGNTAASGDVSGGSTILQSPALNALAGGADDGVVSFSTWYSNDLGTGRNLDVFDIQISPDNGTSWSNLHSIGPTGREVSGLWYNKSFLVSDMATPGAQMRVRFVARDEGDNTIVEAGLDAFRFETIHCLDTITYLDSKILDGSVGSGALSNINDDDGVLVRLNPGSVTNLRKQKVGILLEGICNNPDPDQFRFKLEARMTGGPPSDVIQTVYFINAITGAYEVVDARPTPNSLYLIDVTPSGDLSRFINPLTGEIRAFIAYQSPVFSGAPFNWFVEIDQAVWVASPVTPFSSFTGEGAKDGNGGDAANGGKAD